MSKLRVGDKVIWRGCWGRDLPKETTVTDIDYWAENEHQTNIKEVEWSLVTVGRDVVVSLNNGNWAYGFQLTEINI